MLAQERQKMKSENVVMESKWAFPGNCVWKCYYALLTSQVALHKVANKGHEYSSSYISYCLRLRSEGQNFHFMIYYYSASSEIKLFCLLRNQLATHMLPATVWIGTHRASSRTHKITCHSRADIVLDTVTSCDLLTVWCIVWWPSMMTLSCRE